MSGTIFPGLFAAGVFPMKLADALPFIEKLRTCASLQEVGAAFAGMIRISAVPGTSDASSKDHLRFGLTSAASPPAQWKLLDSRDRKVFGVWALRVAVLYLSLVAAVSLRLVALLSNVLFLTYGYFAHIYPVFVLHAVLLLINIARLATLCSDGVPSWLSPARYFASVGDGMRDISLFVLGLTAGSLGTRAFVRVAAVFVDQCRRSFV